MRVGSGVLPGLPTSRLSHRCCVNKVGVAVGTSLGMVVASTRYNSAKFPGGAPVTHESSLVPTTLSSPTAAALPSIVKLNECTSHEPDYHTDDLSFGISLLGIASADEFTEVTELEACSGKRYAFVAWLVCTVEERSPRGLVGITEVKMDPEGSTRCLGEAHPCPKGSTFEQMWS